MAYSLPLCKALQFSFRLLFAWSPQIHQKYNPEGSLWSFLSIFLDLGMWISLLLAQCMWRLLSSYFFPQENSSSIFSLSGFCVFLLLSLSAVLTPGEHKLYTSESFNRYGCLENCSSLRGVRRKGQNKGQPLCWFLKAPQTYQNAQPQCFKNKVIISPLEPAICTKNTSYHSMSTIRCWWMADGRYASKNATTISY